MSTMIEFAGYGGKPIYIAKEKILSVSKKDENSSQLQIAVGQCSEEWIVLESLESVRLKFDNST